MQNPIPEYSRSSTWSCVKQQWQEQEVSEKSCNLAVKNTQGYQARLLQRCKSHPDTGCDTIQMYYLVLVWGMDLGEGRIEAKDEYVVQAKNREVLLKTINP